MATPPKLDIEILKNNPNAKVIIGLGGAGEDKNWVSGFITQEHTMQGGNIFNNPFENVAQQNLSQKLNVLGATANKVADVANKFLGTNIQTRFGAFSLKSVEQTATIWVSSAKPSFSLPMVFVALQPDDDVLDVVRKLNMAVFPTIDTNGLWVNAPLGYQLVGGKATKGTVIVSIGKWFRAISLLIRDVSYSISKETIKSGLPLYAQVTVAFEAYRLLSSDEVNSWFLKI